MDRGSRSGWIKVWLEFDDLAYGGRRSLLQGSSLIHGLMLSQDFALGRFCQLILQQGVFLCFSQFKDWREMKMENGNLQN